MELSFLIPSKIRLQVLEFFVNDPEAQVYIRELARQLEQSPQQVYRELINLENWGFLFSSKRGRQRVFRLNKKFPFYSGIKDLFETSTVETNRKLEIARTLDWNKRSKHYGKIEIPKEMIKGLTAPRKKPRSYTEEKLLKKKNLL